MGHNKKRPVYLNLLLIRMPVGAVVSILHRVTGLILVLALPLVLYAFELSLRDSAGFDQVAVWLQGLPARIGLLAVFWVLMHHLLAGLRHLLMDIDIGLGRAGARLGAALVLAGGVLATAVLAWRLL